MVSEQSLILSSPPPAPISQLKPRDQCPRWLDDSDCSLGHMFFKPGVWTYALLKTKMRLTSATRAKVRGPGGGVCLGGLGGKNAFIVIKKFILRLLMTRPFVV